MILSDVFLSFFTLFFDCF